MQISGAPAARNRWESNPSSQIAILRTETSLLAEFIRS
jgi:hypothetical protein